jgi:lipopolysaccharide/colanic/teichoic acid biosynthesis glycosyltransferase
MQIERTAVSLPFDSSVCSPAFDPPVWPGRIRRAIDVVLALLLGALSLPLVTVIALLIRLDSRGPFLYTRIRMGERGRPFTMYKFRSMFVDADARLHDYLMADPALQREYARYHKLRQDPRITRMGKVLRRFSLDELPQIWNVLRGEMGIVGPRPYDVGERAKMRELDGIILSVRPGLTGLWQVSGRSHLSFEDRLDLDVRYVTTRSVRDDLGILARTLNAVFLGRGAY